MMKRTTRAGYISFAALGAIALASPAAAQGTCAPFTLISTGDERSVEYVDIGSEGAGHADKRIGVRSLVTEDGSAAGQARWMLTVLEPMGDAGGASYIDWIFALPDGDIFAKSLKAITNTPSDTTKSSSAGTDHFAIVGGTRAYAGARGTHTKTSEGLKETYQLDMSCD